MVVDNYSILTLLLASVGSVCKKEKIALACQLSAFVVIDNFNLTFVSTTTCYSRLIMFLLLPCLCH